MSAEIPQNNPETSIERQKEKLAEIQRAHSEALRSEPGLVDRVSAVVKRRHGYWKIGPEARLTVLRAPYVRDDGRPDAEYIEISVQEDTDEGNKSAVVTVGDLYTDEKGVMVTPSLSFTKEDANLVAGFSQELSIARLSILPDLADNYGSIARVKTQY